MAEIQDEDQWLYGDDKGEPSLENGKEHKDEISQENDKIEDTPIEKEVEKSTDNDKTDEQPENKESAEEEQPEKDKEKENVSDEDSSSDDEATVTIGKIVKQPDIIRPPLPTHRAAPTSGLKDDDFTSVGKINGVPAIEFNLTELEEKPWRKPGADLSDYFNYGFNESTWFKYCERQKSMRNNESGVGLSGLGMKPVFDELVKYPLPKSYNLPPPPSYNQNSQTNSIQVMTADRRTYSNKVINTAGGYDDMDFGGGYDVGTNGGGTGNLYNNPPPAIGAPFFNTPPPIHTSHSWTPNHPPPGFSEPPPVPVPAPSFYDESPKVDKVRSEERELDTPRAPREAREREGRESRHHERRDKEKRSRSHSRTRHTRRRRSRSRSQTHRHKRKKSKREREDRSKSR